MILGQLVTAILIGIIIRALFPVPEKWFTGIQFSNKVILRAGIILLGFRLNLVDIYHAGWRVFLIAALCLSFGITIVYFLAKLLEWIKTSYFGRLWYRDLWCCCSSCNFSTSKS